MPTDKPIFTPSAISDFETCKLLYKTRWEDLLELPVALNPQPTLGTLGHVMQAAYEEGADAAKALAAAIRKLKTGPNYGTAQFRTLSQLETEASLMFRGGTVKDSKGKATSFPGYADYRSGLRVSGEPLVAVAIEKTLFADLGPIIAAPTLDLVLNTEGGEWWVAEWKFTERDDKAWEARWTMDGQTSLQVLAAERQYDQEFRGVLLLPVLYGRKRARDDQDSKSIVGRSIIRVERPEPRWVPKNFAPLRANVMGHLEDLALEYVERKASNRWPASGMFTRSCDLCSLRGICKGTDDPRRLRPMLRTAHQWELAQMRKIRKPL